LGTSFTTAFDYSYAMKPIVEEETAFIANVSA